MYCPHASDSLCQISTKLAGFPVPLAEDACTACNKNLQPQQENTVTISKAIYIARRHNPDMFPLLKEKLLAITHAYKTKGPGTELKKLISWFPLPRTKDCKSCRGLEIRMNKWGPDVCELKMSFIIRKLHIATKRRKLPFSEKLVTILIKRAIKKSRSNGQ